MTYTVGRRLRADAVRNRQALIDAAERLFKTEGLTVTLDEIAAAAGVNVATAYRHFANKHELARAFLQQTIDRVTAITEEASVLDDPWLGLTSFLDGTLELMADNRGLIDVLTHAYGTEWFDHLETHVKPVLRRLIIRGQTEGVVREDLCPEDFGAILPMLGSIRGPTPEISMRLRRRYLSLLLAGMRPSPIPLPGPPPSDADIRPNVLPPRGTGTAH